MVFGSCQTNRNHRWAAKAAEEGTDTAGPAIDPNAKTLDEEEEDADETLPAWRKGPLRKRSIVSIRCFARAGRIQGLVSVQLLPETKS